MPHGKRDYSRNHTTAGTEMGERKAPTVSLFPGILQRSKATRRVVEFSSLRSYREANGKARDSMRFDEMGPLEMLTRGRKYNSTRYLD